MRFARQFIKPIYKREAVSIFEPKIARIPLLQTPSIRLGGVLFDLLREEAVQVERRSRRRQDACRQAVSGGAGPFFLYQRAVGSLCLAHGLPNGGGFPPYPFKTRRPLCARPAGRKIDDADGFAPSPAVRIAGNFAGRETPGNSYSFAVCRPLSRRFVKSAESFLALFAARRRFDAFFGKPTTYWERFFGRPLYRASVDIVYIIIFT